MTSISPNKLNEPAAPAAGRAAFALTGVAALGIVFGDIGTSPLYTLKTAFDFLHGEPTPDRILGILSLVIWTLFLVTSVKYVLVAMSLDNDGEGGILALMSLLGVGRRRRPAIILAGLLGAALIYGDGAITPAISVLSALEGLYIAAPDLKHYVLPAAVVILTALFAVQPLGTARIGAAFGPIMALWFVSIGALGLWGIAQDPWVLAAINPLYGVRLLFTNGLGGFLVLGGIFLCVTGAEALYADMGHFGRGPIRAAWAWVVFPCLVLNYAGQSAIALRGAPIANNIFFRLCPEPLLIPLVCLATVATIIASQSIITGAFSMTRQAIQLGWLPRLHIKQTSDKGLRPNLCRRRQLATDDRHHRSDASFPQVRRSCRRLRHRRLADDADDIFSPVHRHARDLAWSLAASVVIGRRVCDCRRRFLRGKLAEDRRWRLCSAVTCCGCLRHHAALASGLGCGGTQARGNAGARA